MRKRSLREPHVDLRRELEPDTAGVARCRSAPEAIALEDDDVADAPQPKVIGDGCAKDAAPDDDDLGPLHAVGPASGYDCSGGTADGAMRTMTSIAL